LVIGGLIIALTMWIVRSGHRHTEAGAMGSSDRNEVVVFATANGYTVLYIHLEQRRGLAVIRLDLAGRPIAGPDELGFVDAFGAARIGDYLIVATSHDTNRGDDAEPDMDVLVVRALPMQGGAPVEIFRLEKQNVGLSGPRVVTSTNGGFKVMWPSFRGRLLAQAFDARRQPIGAPEVSPSYGRSVDHLAVATSDAGSLAFVALTDEDSKVAAILPSLDGSSFPVAVPVATIRGYEPTPMVAARGTSFGAVWTSRDSTTGTAHLWFTTLDKDGHRGDLRELPTGNALDRPVELVATERGWLVIYSTHYQPDVDTGTWSLMLDADGLPIDHPRPFDRFPVWALQLVWTGDGWLGLRTSSGSCALEVGRLSEDGRVFGDRRCVVPGRSPTSH
jgi:hypothetical protein